jgi:putative DNA primase/helicase
MSSIPHANGESKQRHQDFPLAKILARRSAAYLNGGYDDDDRWEEYLAYQEEQRAEEEAAAAESFRRQYGFQPNEPLPPDWLTVYLQDVDPAEVEDEDAPELSLLADHQGVTEASNGTEANGTEAAAASTNEAAPELDAAEEPVEPPSAGRHKTAKEDPADPYYLARRFLENHLHDGKEDTIVRFQQNFHYWRRAAYRRMEDEDVRGHLTASIKEEFDALARNNKKRKKARKVSMSLVSNTLQALQSMTGLDADVRQPCWLRGTPAAIIQKYPAREMLACKNGLVHVPSVLDGGQELFAPTPRFFTPNALDYDFDFAAAAPKLWLRFLDQIWKDDAESILTLQEWFGYCLLPDTSQQKILLMIGPPRSGRGTIARVLTQLLGDLNVAGCNLTSLGGNFGLQPLLDKSLAIIADARLQRLVSNAKVSELLLNISGEDRVPIDRKYKTPLSVTLATRLMMLSNEVPELPDTSGALPGRFIVLAFTNDWEADPDTQLTDTLCQELPGILRWSLDGLKSLRQRGKFHQPASAAELVDILTNLSSPLKAWLEACCQLGPKCLGNRQGLYDCWEQWCGKHNINPGGFIKFCRDMKAAVRGLVLERPRVPGEEARLERWRGVCRKPEFRQAATDPT